MSYHSSSTEHAGQLIRLGLFRLLTCGTRLISPIFRALNAVAQLVDLLRSHGDYIADATHKRARRWAFQTLLESLPG